MNPISEVAKIAGQEQQVMRNGLSLDVPLRDPARGEGVPEVGHPRARKIPGARDAGDEPVENGLGRSRAQGSAVVHEAAGGQLFDQLAINRRLEGVERVNAVAFVNLEILYQEPLSACLCCREGCATKV
jgi:hypothetical protein